MGGERHLLSNNADIEATINSAIEHFLYEESFREEQKQTAGNNYPVCMTDSLNVRLRATEIRFA